MSQTLKNSHFGLTGRIVDSGQVRIWQFLCVGLLLLFATNCRSAMTRAELNSHIAQRNHDGIRANAQGGTLLVEANEYPETEVKNVLMMLKICDDFASEYEKNTDPQTQPAQVINGYKMLTTNCAVLTKGSQVSFTREILSEAQKHHKFFPIYERLASMQKKALAQIEIDREKQRESDAKDIAEREKNAQEDQLRKEQQEAKMRALYKKHKVQIEFPDKGWLMNQDPSLLKKNYYYECKDFTPVMKDVYFAFCHGFPHFIAYDKKKIGEDDKLRFIGRLTHYDYSAILKANIPFVFVLEMIGK